MDDFAYENYEFDSDVYEEIETTYNLLKEQPSSLRKKLTIPELGTLINSITIYKTLFWITLSRLV